MSKRRSELELTHDNWNDDLPTEEAGSFCVASKEEMDKRVLKKAKRRLPEVENKGGGVFAGFAGFGKSPNANGKIFDFLSSASNKVDRKMDFPAVVKPPEVVNSKDNTTNSMGTPKNSISKLRLEYCQNLRQLNEDFVAWVKGHIDKNPYLDLTPVFRDYGNHLKMLEEKYPDNTINKKVVLSPLNPPEIVPKEIAPKETPPAAPSSTVLKSEEESKDVKEEAEDEENYKTEVKIIEEDNTIYKTRCKLFYKKDASFVEKGIGTLYIKSIDDKKNSLLIRAETAIGQILLNILLIASIPMQRVGKNNVTLVCIPNPSSSEAVTFLIRVKDGEMADELLKKLQEAKMD